MLTRVGDTGQTAWVVQIGRFRKAKGLKQAALAHMLNVDQATISRWETGRSVPELAMQRRLRDLMHSLPTEDAVLKHSVGVSFGQVVLSTKEQIMLAASCAYSTSHGFPPEEMIGRSTRPMYTEDGVRLWRQNFEAGFFRGDVASCVTICWARSLNVNEKRGTKVLWTPVRLSDGEIILRGDRIPVSVAEYDAAVAANGGQIQIVTMDQLVQ